MSGRRVCTIRRLGRLALLLLVAALAAVTPACGGTIGSPVLVCSGGAFWPEICYNATADQHLVLWVDVTDANGWQLKGRRFDPDTGGLVGSEFYVSPDPVNVKAIIGAACYNSTNGEWLITYQANIAGLGFEDDILGQRIASDGTKIGGYISLVVKDNYQNAADVAFDPANGRYLVVWSEKPGAYKTVKGQFFDQAGSAVGAEFQIRDTAIYDSHSPKVAYNPVAGEFMVIWQDYRNYIGSGQDNEYSDIYGQRINASTRAKIGGNIAIYWGGSPYLPNGQDIPGGLVCNTTDGRYFIPIQKLTSTEYYRTYGLVANYDGSWHSANVFDVSRPEFGVPTGAGYDPVDNTYFVSYESLTDGFPNAIRGRQFSAAGLGIGGRVYANNAAGGTRDGVLAVRPSDGQYTQLLCTDSNGSIYAQRFTNDLDIYPPANVNPLRAYRQPDSTVLLTWANPADPDVAGTLIRYRTDTYPTSITDGTLVCNRAASASSSDSFAHLAPPGQTCYYTAFSYDALPNYSSGANAASSNVWLDEPFDNYALGNLDPQGGWTKDPAKNSCVVQNMTRVGSSGNAIELFGTATIYDDATVANFGAITGGYHRVSFDMRRNASAASNQAFIGVFQGPTIITRVYWSANFSVLHGTGASFTDLVTGPAPNQWYHVELGIDLANGTLDAWVDGVQKLFARPFYQSATQINTINLTGYSAATAASYLDNLRGERVAAAPAAPIMTLPTIGSDVEGPRVRVEWTGDTHEMLEVHVNTSNVPTDGSAYDSGALVSSAGFHKVGPLASGQEHYVFVRLHNSSGWGSWSAAGQRFRVVPNVNPPGQPADLTAMGTNAAVKLACTNPPDKDLSGVVIRCRGDRCPTSSTNGALVSSIAGAAPGAAGSFVHSPLANGIKRYYAVFACDDGGLYSIPACAAGAAEPWTVEYHADALPSASSPLWTMLDDGGSESWAHIESGGILHVLDDSTAWGSKIRWYRNWAASNATGSTVLVRAKCDLVLANEYTQNITLCDGARYINFIILPDRVASKADATAVPDRQYLLDGTAWHRYRFTLKGTTYACYVDESSSPVFTGTAYATTTNQVLFGANGSTATQSLYFDYLFYRTDGAFAPASESDDITTLKSKPDGASVTLAAATVTACYDGFFYVAYENRLGGIRVVKVNHGRSIGEHVDIKGTLGANAGERYVAASLVAVSP